MAWYLASTALQPRSSCGSIIGHGHWWTTALRLSATHPPPRWLLNLAHFLVSAAAGQPQSSLDTQPGTEIPQDYNVHNLPPSHGAPPLGGLPAPAEDLCDLPTAPHAAGFAGDSVADLPTPPGFGTAPAGASPDDLDDLPAPPRAAVQPAAGSSASMPAASAGPRFRPGSRVLWQGDGGEAEPGTVGKVDVSVSGARYKVALKSRILDVLDEELAPNISAGGRVVYVAAIGARPVGAMVVAMDPLSW
jgi:hypothetical protein